MQKNIWVHVFTVVVMVGLTAGLLLAGYGLYLLGGDLFAESEEFDGVGIILGLFVLALALPLVASMVVLLRRLRRPDPPPGLIGAGAIGALLLPLGLLWAPVPFMWWVVLVPAAGLALVLSNLRIAHRRKH